MSNRGRSLLIGNVSGEKSCAQHGLQPFLALEEDKKPSTDKGSHYPEQNQNFREPEIIVKQEHDQYGTDKQLMGGPQ